MRLLYSVRSPADVIYADELGEQTLLTFSRSAPEDWSGHRGRIDKTFVAQGGAGLADGIAFVCGSNGFVETGAQLLIGAGFAAERIRTERFGPS